MGGFLAERRRHSELMDAPDIAASEHRRALAGLERINRLSAAVRPIWNQIAPLIVRTGGALRVLDVACGGGEVAVGLQKRALRAGLDIEVFGLDISSLAVQVARERASAEGLVMRFAVGDAVATPIDIHEHYDVVMSSLFLHHLDEHDALRLLRHSAAAATRRVLVVDLRRSLRGYVLAVLGTRALSRSPVVHYDGPASVRAAFHIEEACRLAERAGLQNVRAEARWPFRFLLSADPA